MNWEALGAIGEMLAAIGVVGSLLFVGIQVRKANLDAKARGFAQQSIDYRDLLFQAGPYVNVLRRGWTSFGDLTLDEQTLFHIWMTAHVQDAQNQFLQLRYESQDRDSVNRVLRVHAMFLNTPGGMEWWRHSKLVWDEEFVLAIDELSPSVGSIGEVFPWLLEKGA